MSFKIPATHKMIENLLAGSKQIPRSQVVKDLCDIIRRMPLETMEIGMFHQAILSRVRAKHCVRCGKLKADGIEGSVRSLDGHATFLCSACQEVLIAAGKL